MAPFRPVFEVDWIGVGQRLSAPLCRGWGQCVACDTRRRAGWRSWESPSKPVDKWRWEFQDCRVHVSRLRLRDFRNYVRLDLELGPGCHLFLGNNAQGKTNVLEALYLVATLRSFRGVGGAQMVREGARGYFVGATIDSQGLSEVKAYWSSTERKLTLNERPVRRLSEYFGVLRAVVFCSEDLALVKGASRGRRRFLDLILAQTEPGYLTLLMRYARALKSRNALLKHPMPDEAQLEGFSHEVVSAGTGLMAARTALLPRITPWIQDAFRRISGDVDELELRHRPGVREDFAVALSNSRARERVMRTTLVGPHRDDVEFLVNGRNASQYTSEGQKRTLALALKLAQAEYLSSVVGTPPVLLIDDVMGELDASRRAAFMPLLERAFRAGGQVFMTCTEENWPQEMGRNLTRWSVQRGGIVPVAV
jgi:DNA replication and repair protein RecF